MRSKTKLLESLANQFLENTYNEKEVNVKLAQVPQTQESNLGPAVQDAFFGPPSPGLGHPEFVKKLGTPESNFTKATQDVSGQIVIDIMVDAPAKRAIFIVKAAVKPQVKAAIEAALVADYTAMYGKSPSVQLQERLAAGTVRPANIRGTANVTTL
jgi:hypothetical protein